jgi:hypothetical protein
MEDRPILDDEFKSDKFEISINELLFSSSYRSSVNSVSKLLDDNGYFGRYKIETFITKKYGTDVLVKIHVYLCDSRFTYIWPHQTFFNLNKRMFGANRKLPRGILNDKNVFMSCCKNISGMFASKQTLPFPPSFGDLKSLAAMEEIEKLDAGLDRWGYILCKHHDSFNLLSYYEKLIPFLCRVGLITNNKFKIKSKQDAEEVCLNLFDVNYWYNI